MLVAMRVIQGFGGAMMTPVGRLILLRSFPRAGLVSAMNWMTIPAMIGPTVGPIVGGILTSYASWRWIFYLEHADRGDRRRAGVWLFEDYRAPSPTRFDSVGFAIAGMGLFLLEMAIENLGRPMVPPLGGDRLLPAVAGGSAGATAACRPDPAPVLDLDLLQDQDVPRRHDDRRRLPMGLDATPVLLPLLFQIGFGMTPVQSGLLSFSSTLGAMAVRSFSRTILRIAGFRLTLVLGAILSAATTAGFALLHADTPTAIIVAAVLALRLHPQHSVPRPQHDQLRRSPRPAFEP